MSSLPPIKQSTTAHFQLQSRCLTLRIWCWSAALSLGAAQAWSTRFTMNPDGVSYLDIGDAYWRGDWSNAVNAYWSPFYSWILGFLIKLVKPSIYWEYPIVHLGNFMIYVGALACFDFFLQTFVADRRQRDRDLLKSGECGLGEFSWYLLGYGLFISSSLVMIGLNTVTPDMCIAGFVYLASGLIMRIRSTNPPAIFIALGLVLGLAYLTKAVMFPLALVYFLVALAAGSFSRQFLRNTALAAMFFLAIAGPFIVAISHQKKRLTFGDAGSWNYAHYVNHVNYWPSGSAMLKHPMRRLAASPPIYEFAGPVSGTFPPWYDPTYWHEGITSHLTIKGEAEPIIAASRLYAICFLVVFLGVTAGACILHLQSTSLRRSLHSSLRIWPVLIPVLATFALYSLVHVEARFVGPHMTVFFMVLYSGVTFPVGGSHRRWAAYAIPCVIGTLALTSLVAWHHWQHRDARPTAQYWNVADALLKNGNQARGPVALIWNEKWNAGAGEGAFVPRLLKLKIIAEVPDADAFWKLDAAAQQQILHTIRGLGVNTVLARSRAGPVQDGWKRLGETDYFAYVFAQRPFPSALFPTRP